MAHIIPFLLYLQCLISHTNCPPLPRLEREVTLWCKGSGYRICITMVNRYLCTPTYMARLFHIQNPLFVRTLRGRGLRCFLRFLSCVHARTHTHPPSSPLQTIVPLLEIYICSVYLLNSLFSAFDVTAWHIIDTILSASTFIS